MLNDIYDRLGHVHGEVQEGHEAHQIDQHEQEVVLDALKSA
jgi:hypothetical protein